MTEVGFNAVKSGGIFSQSSSKTCEGLDSFLDSFWSETLDFLGPPPLDQQDPNSPSSTESTASLDTALPSSPRANQSPQWETVLGGGIYFFDRTISSTKTVDEHDGRAGEADHDETISPLVWTIGMSNQAEPRQIVQTNSKQMAEVGLMHDFEERLSSADYLGTPLESADTAWTNTIDLPTLAAEDVSHLLCQTSTASTTPSPTNSYRLPFQRKRQKRWPTITTTTTTTKNTYNQGPIQNDIDSCSTETSSEAEVDSLPESRQQVRRKRMLICGRLELVEDIDCSTTEFDEDEDEDERPVRRRRVKSKRKQHHSYSVRPTTSQPPSPVSDTEPWWPPGAGLSQQLEGGRNRRQFELWEFILRSLDGSTSKTTTSAFQWVDRAVGVFRVTDTQKAAREWGRYRGNERMDYEKMARAMRFYYKDSILRKARRQLHFQFAMRFVEWSELQHSLPFKAK